MAARLLAVLVWIFGPLGVLLLRQVLPPWEVLLAALWLYLPLTPGVALRPRWMPKWLAWAATLLASILLIAGVIFLPFWPSLVLAAAWIPVAVWAHWRFMQRQARIATWRAGKVLEFKTLVEGGMPDAEAAARVNEQFGDVPGEIPSAMADYLRQTALPD